MTTLTDLPSLLRDDPVVADLLSGAAPVVAIPEPARPLVVSALARLSSRRPLLVAVPTQAEAERLAHDLEAFLGRDTVDQFPAWETLPFERVSPTVETMGRRLRTMWRIRNCLLYTSDAADE